MTQVGSLYTSLTLESQSFVSGLNRAADQAERTGKRIEKGLTSAKTAATGFFAAVAASELTGAVDRGLEYAASLGEQAQQLGINTRELQIYRYAASQAGVEQAAMDKSLAKLTLNLGKAAAGAKAPREALDALGISLGDIEGKSAGQVLPLIAEGLSKIPDPAKRAAIEVALFGKTGQQLDVLLAGGRKGIDDLAQSAADLGLILDDKLIAQADDAADKVATLKQVLEVKLAATVAQNADKISYLADSLIKLIDAAPEALRFLDQIRLKAAIAQESSGIALGVLLRSESRIAGAKLRRAEAQGALGQLQQQTLLDDLARKFPLGGVLPSRLTRVDDDDAAGGGGGGTGRRRSAGGAASRVETIDERTRRLSDAIANDNGSAYTSNFLQLAGNDAHELGVDLDFVTKSLTGVKTGLEGVDLGSLWTVEDQARFEELTSGLNEDLARGLAGAIVYGENLGDVLVGSIRRAAAELLASKLLSLLNPKGDGGFVGSLIGGLLGKPGKANGGWGRGLTLVGERGPELADLGGGANVIPNGALRGLGGGGAARVTVVPSAYFDVVVDGRADGRVALAAPQIVAGSSAGTQRAMARRAGRRLA